MKPETVTKVISTDNPKISVIIPTIREQDLLAGLLSDIEDQTEKSVEVILAYKFSPSGKARNAGAAAAKGTQLIFMDDDIRLGDAHVLENLSRVLDEDAKIGLTGASTLIPPQANAFQRRAGKEIPRMQYPVVDQILESDMVTTQCWAQTRNVFQVVGQFSERIERGVDPEYRSRVRKNGFKVVIAPHTWTYHPPPKDFASFCKQTFRNGRASARAQRDHPDLVVPVPDSGAVSGEKDVNLINRIFRSLGRIILNLARLRLLAAAERIVYAYGYFCGRFGKEVA